MKVIFMYVLFTVLGIVE